MNPADEQQRSAMSVLQNILVVLVIAVLTALLLRHWLATETAQWQQTEFEVARNRFSQNVSLVRVTWMAQGKPKRATLKTQTRGIVFIPVNDRGWPSVSVGCDKLWLALTGQLLEGGLRAVRSEHHCDYFLGKRGGFRYDERTGQISQPSGS